MVALNELWGFNEALALLHPLFLLLFPSFHPNLALGEGRAAVAPAKKFPPPLPLFTFSTCFCLIFLWQGRRGSLQPIVGETLTPQGPLLWGGRPQTWRGPQLCGGPQPRGGPSPFGGPSAPLVAGGGPPECQERGGGGHPPAPPGFGGVTNPPFTAPGFGGLPGLGGRRPPALTQPCSCSAPGRGRSPAAASLALVWGGELINELTINHERGQ